MRLKGFVVVLIVSLFVCFCIEAYAVPTFARKYRTSCQTCHSVFPKLTPFGEAYRKNGFMIVEGDMAYVKEEPVSMGAEAYKRVWPDAVWPTTIPAYVPLSLLVIQRFNWNLDDDNKTEFNFPHELELMWAGTFGEDLTFFAELEAEGSEVGIGGTWLTWNDLFMENLINVKAGFFDIMSNKPYNSHRRLTISRNSIENYRVASGGFRFRDDQAGIELNGFKNRIAYAAGLVNGTGGMEDDNKTKDPYYRVDLKLFGMPFDSSGQESGAELKSEKNWQDNSVQIGTFGYFGEQEHTKTTKTTVAGVTTTTTTEFTNELSRLGVDGRVLFYNLDVVGGYLWGNDDDPRGTGTEIDSNAWFVEAQYHIFPWLVPALRYEETLVDDKDDVEKVVASLNVLARANLKAIIEGEIFVDEEDGDDKVTVDLRYVF